MSDPRRSDVSATLLPGAKLEPWIENLRHERHTARVGVQALEKWGKIVLESGCAAEVEFDSLSGDSAWKALREEPWLKVRTFSRQAAGRPRNRHPAAITQVVGT